MPMPKPSNAEERSGNLPFLQADDLKKGEQKIDVIGVRKAPASMEFSDFLLEVEVKGRRYVLGVKVDTSTYDTLHKQFGSDETKWKGSITVRPRYTGKYANGFVDVLETLK